MMDVEGLYGDFGVESYIGHVLGFRLIRGERCRGAHRALRQGAFAATPATAQTTSSPAPRR